MDHEIKLVDHTVLASEMGNVSVSHEGQILSHETLIPVSYTHMCKAAVQMHILLWTTDQKSLRATDISTVFISVICTDLSLFHQRPNV